MTDFNFKNGDILVCKPGFNNNNKYINELSGGSGYVEGGILSAKLLSTEFNITSNTIIWGFKNGSGVFAQVLRKATDDEASWYVLNVSNNNLSNISQMPQTNISQMPQIKTFIISYFTTNGTLSKTIIEAPTESEAISKIKDFKTLSYVMQSII